MRRSKMIKLQITLQEVINITAHEEMMAHDGSHEETMAHDGSHEETMVPDDLQWFDWVV